MRKTRGAKTKAVKTVLAIVGDKDTTTYTLNRSVEGRVWVSTWEAGDKGYGGFGGVYSPKDFDRVMVKGKSLRVLVEQALEEVDREGEKATDMRVRRRKG